MAKAKQGQLEGMPQPDQCAKIAMEVHEANLMISEGNEQRKEASEALAAALIESGREKVTVFCEDDQCYRTFRLKKLKAQNKILVKKEKQAE